MVYFQLFFVFFKIGLFGFGGGAAMISMIQHDLVEVYGWTSAQEFTNMVAISQMTPGPIGINCATYAGYLATGNAFGALVATLALILPSYVIVSLIITLLKRYRNSPYIEGTMQGLRPTVVGLIAAAGIVLINEESFGENCADWLSWLIFAVSFVVTKWFKFSPIYLLVIVAVFGMVVYV